ncbi:MAG: hypothetical protein ACYSPI_04410, partial [Planctomycetota bacterium]
IGNCLRQFPIGMTMRVLAGRLAGAGSDDGTQCVEQIDRRLTGTGRRVCLRGTRMKPPRAPSAVGGLEKSENTVDPFAHCLRADMNGKKLAERKTQGTKKTGETPFFLFPGPWSPPLLARGHEPAEQGKGRRPSTSRPQGRRRARDPARGGHCPRRGGSLRKRQTSASRGDGASECDWRTDSVGHEDRL